LVVYLTVTRKDLEVVDPAKAELEVARRPTCGAPLRHDPEAEPATA